MDGSGQDYIPSPNGKKMGKVDPGAFWDQARAGRATHMMSSSAVEWQDREAGKEATKKVENTDPKRPGLGKVPGSQPSLHVLLQRGTRSPKRTGLTHSGT